MSISDRQVITGELEELRATVGMNLSARKVFEVVNELLMRHGDEVDADRVCDALVNVADSALSLRRKIRYSKGHSEWQALMSTQDDKN